MLMNRALLNLLIDSVVAVLLTVVVASGYILWFVLPPGTNRTHSLWGLLRHEFGTVHFWVSAALLCVVTVHVALHWRWLVTGLSKRFGAGPWAARNPRLAGLAWLAAAAVPLIVLATAAHLSVKPLARPLHPPAGQPHSDDPAADRATPTSAPTTGADAAAAVAVLSAHCASCHGPDAPAGRVRADAPAALLAEQNGIRWVTIGSPADSRLFAVVGPTSPTPKHRLAERDVDTLRAWIAARRRE